MRRAALILVPSFLLFSSCFSRAGLIDPEATAPGARGVRTPAAQNTACREVSRTRCAANECRGANMDEVTYHCSGGKTVRRCVANLKCSAG